MGVILFLVLAINSDASRTVCRTLVIRTVKQIVQLARNSVQRRDNLPASTRVADSSRCMEHIINPLQYRVKRVKAVKIEDSMKPISGSQCMKSGLTKVSDQCLPIDW
jgi:hypothetical protein